MYFTMNFLNYYHTTTGVVDINWEKEMPTMSTVRWRTTFIRILRYYVQEENPSENLINLVTYIVQGCDIYQFS